MSNTGTPAKYDTTGSMARYDATTGEQIFDVVGETVMAMRIITDQRPADAQFIDAMRTLFKKHGVELRHSFDENEPYLCSVSGRFSIPIDRDFNRDYLGAES